MVSPTTTLPGGAGAEYKIPGGVVGGTGREKDWKRAFVSRMWNRSFWSLATFEGGGGRSRGRGVTVPLDAIESRKESEVLGRLGGCCSSSFLMMTVATGGL